ncbi:MAG: DUF4197 domain-containing protein [Gammaproteobacteria bacterium]|nr:DUF4197 domain-containing protein [Gammaproteobacteria bacterium]
MSSCVVTDQAQNQQWINSGQSLLKALGEKPLTEQDIAKGLKEALTISADRVVMKISQTNGYLNDQAIHIALPDEVNKVHQSLKKIGLDSYTHELEVKMNHAAEMAAPRAKALFLRAISDMKWQDVQAIYKGRQDAATQYFKNKMTTSLHSLMRPVVQQTLAEAGVVQLYEKIITKYHAIPFVPKVKNNLADYVVAKSIDGVFYYLAQEEAAIRKEPAKRTTELLKRMFG